MGLKLQKGKKTSLQFPSIPTWLQLQITRQTFNSLQVESNKGISQNVEPFI